MTPETLNRVGTALYGPLWQTQLSRALGVNDRTIRRWVSGDATIPDSIREDLRRIINNRKLDLNELASVIE